MAVALLNSCVAFFMPASQTVTFRTNQEDAEIYVDNKMIGKGEGFEVKIRKEGVKQVVVRVPEQKDVYHVLVPESRPIAFYPLILLDIPFIIPLAIDPALDKSYNYAKVLNYEQDGERIIRNNSMKYIMLDVVKIAIKDKNKDIQVYNLPHSAKLDVKMAEMERKRRDAIKHNEQTASRKKKEVKLLTDNNRIMYEDSKYSDALRNTLRHTGFIDTVSRVFYDYSNSLILDGVISKIDRYFINFNTKYYYQKAKLTILWKIYNHYGELLDSILLLEKSGSFLQDDYFSNNTPHADKMMSDAVENSFQELFMTYKFQQYLAIDTAGSFDVTPLKLPAITNGIKEISDVLEASVIVKRKDGGHGSGFAITNDGYILTNYHVIAGETLDKQDDISIILPNGVEIPVSVVRFNRASDVALLKVDHQFSNAFLLPDVKEYKNHIEVYAAGAPKSIELGNSVSLGLISNERKLGTNPLLQVSISINSGNSGGALFSKSGSLYGVVNAKLAGYATEGVGFAIPAYLVPGYLNISYGN